MTKDIEPAMKGNGRGTGKNQTWRRPRTLLAVVLVAALGAGGWGLKYYRDQGAPRSLVPAAIRQQVDFPLYYPTRLPDGYRVSGLPVVSEGVLAMSVTTSSGNTIFVSEQAAPVGLNYQDFLSTQLKRPQEVSTSAGLGYIGGSAGRVLGSVLTSKTWILINASLAGNTESEAKSVLKSLSLQK